MTGIKSALAEKGNRKEIDTLSRKIDDLENRSKRNNVVIWGLKEGAEKDCSAVGEFSQDELFSKHIGSKILKSRGRTARKSTKRLRTLALCNQGLFTSTYLDIPINDEF